MAGGRPQVVLTAAGLAKLQAELDELTNVRRPEVTRRIREAKSHGDLRENFDFHDAKREQAFIEGRIAALKETLGRARLVAAGAANDGQVTIGATVDLVNLDSGAASSYTIVGAMEADPRAGRISNASPVGQALLGKRVDDTVETTTPRGTQRYRIAAVRHEE